MSAQHVHVHHLPWPLALLGLADLGLLAWALPAYIREAARSGLAQAEPETAQPEPDPALSEPCGYCHAQPGQPCTSGQGRKQAAVEYGKGRVVKPHYGYRR